LWRETEDWFNVSHGHSRTGVGRYATSHATHTEAPEMKAARLEDGDLRIRELEVPVPAADEALVRIRTSGVCHSDLHIARGDWMGVPRAGGLGHEAIGVVEALGPGAERVVSVGDRVILGLGGMGGGYWCGACEYCLRGKPNLCSQAKPLMGTFAEQLCVWAPALVSVPDELDDREAPLACGGLTAYGAVKKLVAHGITPGRTIAVIGAAGGLGHYAVQIATVFGYRAPHGSSSSVPSAPRTWSLPRKLPCSP
jgi:propanol-preferring alcohol dehydrogenase